MDSQTHGSQTYVSQIGDAVVSWLSTLSVLSALSSDSSLIDETSLRKIRRSPPCDDMESELSPDSEDILLTSLLPSEIGRGYSLAHGIV